MYGNVQNRVSVGHVKKGGKLGYIVSRLFPPKQSVLQVFPSARNYPMLLPLYYIRRFLRLLLPDRRRASLQELQAARAVDADGEEQIAALLDRLGL